MAETMTQPRMLTRVKAAAFCKIERHRFEIECPVRPIVFDVPGKAAIRRWDRKRLSVWLKERKAINRLAEEKAGNPVVYFIADGEFVKIGTTKLPPHIRLGQLQTASPVPLYLALLIRGGRLLEAELHDQFAQYRSEGEWFYLSDEIRAFIESEGGDLP